VKSSNVDLRSIPELVRDLLDQESHEENGALASVVRLAYYDLDYFAYVLVQTWDYVESKFGDADVHWEVSLWYDSNNTENPVMIWDFPDAKNDVMPYIASGEAVEKHIKYVMEYTAENNELP
jgi:hypothetical protein